MRNVLGTATHHTCGDSLLYRPTFSLLFNRVGKNEFYILHFTKSTKYYRVTTFWEMLGLLKCWDSHFWGHLLRNAGILDFPPKNM